MDCLSFHTKRTEKVQKGLLSLCVRVGEHSTKTSRLG